MSYEPYIYNIVLNIKDKSLEGKIVKKIFFQAVKFPNPVDAEKGNLLIGYLDEEYIGQVADPQLRAQINFIDYVPLSLSSKNDTIHADLFVNPDYIDKVTAQIREIMKNACSRILELPTEFVKKSELDL